MGYEAGFLQPLIMSAAFSHFFASTWSESYLTADWGETSALLSLLLPTINSEGMMKSRRSLRASSRAAWELPTLIPFRMGVGVGPSQPRKTALKDRPIIVVIAQKSPASNRRTLKRWWRPQADYGPLRDLVVDK